MKELAAWHTWFVVRATWKSAINGMGGRLSSRVGLASLVAIACITRPSRASLLRVLAAFATRRTGFFGGALTRGALAFSEFASQLGSPDAIVLHDLTLCTVATADAAVCTDIFNDESRCAFVGILGHWFCVRYAKQQMPEFMYVCSTRSARASTRPPRPACTRVIGAQLLGFGPRLSAAWATARRMGMPRGNEYVAQLASGMVSSGHDSVLRPGTRRRRPWRRCTDG